MISDDHRFKEKRCEQTIGNDHNEVQEKANVLLPQLGRFLDDLIEQRQLFLASSFHRNMVFSPLKLCQRRQR
jgi:hypothetical protein